MNDIAAKQMTILIATDGSQSSQTAIELVRSMTMPEGSVVWLVSVLETDVALITGAWAPVATLDIDEGLAEMTEAAQAMLDSAATSFGQGVRVETEVLRGRPGSMIVEKAQAVGADLVVLGNRGLGTIESMLLGSTGAEVADHAHCPVLIARQPGLTRVVLGTDGSAYARIAEDVVAGWPIFERVPIEVVAAADLALPWTSGIAFGSAPISQHDLVELRRGVIEEYQHAVDGALSRLTGLGRQATGRVVEGDPATELMRVAKEGGADLVVVGTHGSTGLKRLLAGSVARNVMLHAPCSVMVVREARPVT